MAKRIDRAALRDTGPRTALITGAAGQDGQLLAAQLLAEGCQVVGIRRPGGILPSGPAGMRWVQADLREPGLFDRLLPDIRADEIYHLAALHHSSQEGAARHDMLRSHREMIDVNFSVCSALALAALQQATPCRLVFAASSQMYTAVQDVTTISENTSRQPSSFYGHVKSWAADLLSLLRCEHGLHASTAILFNHESSLRRPQFVSRKISLAAAAAAAGKPVPLSLMNIGARVDWSAAADVVAALRLMARADVAQDCVVASGQLHSVRELLATAFSHVGLDWRDYTDYKRDDHETALCGNPQQIEALGWQRRHSFKEWIHSMVDHDLASARLKS